jgi:hypothetical protein
MAYLVVPTDSALYHALQTLVENQRVVCFAGLPGTGKSLLLHQLAHLAGDSGRTVSLLQWDVARPRFEAHPTGQRYPVRQDITHGVIRKAVGMWARHALVQWHLRHPEPSHLLIGETPFIGHRFIELARRRDDPAEALLANVSSLFIIPVPSRQVRRFIEVERRRRRANPLHTQESEDAPPQVLEALWREMTRIALLLGVISHTPTADESYDPAIYQGVYQALLKHRRTRVVPLDTLLPTTTMSVYNFAVEPTAITPSADEIARFIEEVEHQYPDAAALERELEQWYVV